MKDEPEGLSPLGEEMIAGLAEFAAALEAGEPIEERFRVRDVALEIRAKPYGPEDLRRFRRRFCASQTLLAKFLGVDVKILRSWEKGTRKVPAMACRFLDEIDAHPDLWKGRLLQAMSAGS